jgi:hypothetical protein
VLRLLGKMKKKLIIFDLHHRVTQEALRLRCVRSFCCGVLHHKKPPLTYTTSTRKARLHTAGVHWREVARHNVPACYPSRASYEETLHCGVTKQTEWLTALWIKVTREKPILGSETVDVLTALCDDLLVWARLPTFAIAKRKADNNSVTSDTRSRSEEVSNPV